MAFFVYILECNDASYYVGHSENIEERISVHNLSLLSGYTSTRLPVQLVFSQEFGTRVEALEAELQIKRWTRKKKKALITGNWSLLVTLSKKNFNAES